MGPGQTAQISDHPQKEESSLKFVMLHGTEEEKLGDGKESLLQN